MLIAVEAQAYFELPLLEQRRDAYRPVGSRLSDHELRSVIQMVEQLEEGQINEHGADQTAAAVSRRRALLRFGNGVDTRWRSPAISPQ